MAGHLVIEFLLKELAIQKSGTNIRRSIEGLSHAKLIDKNKELYIINDSMALLLHSINRFRNRFAHQLNFEPSKDEWVNLFLQAEVVLSDSTNGVYQGLEEVRSDTSLEKIDAWVFAELFIQTANDLHKLYVSHPG